MTDHPYVPLGFPLTNLPRPGEPVSSLTMCDTVYPLLHGARALTTAVSVSLRTGDLDSERASWALALIEGMLEGAFHILQRWEETQDMTRQEASGASQRAAGRHQRTEHPQEKGPAHE